MSSQGIERALTDIALALSRSNYGLISPDYIWHEIGATDEPVFSDSWVNYGGTWSTCAFRKDAMGFVHLKGMVKNGSVGVYTIFTLPAGYRPSSDHLFIVSSNDAAGRCDIYSSGIVRPRGGSSVYFSLDGITFKADQ